MRYIRLSLLILIYLTATAANAETYGALLTSIDICLRNNDWTGAEKYIKEALRKEPANPNNYLLISNLGTVHRNMGQTQEALADYDNALSIAPNATTILHNRASLLLEADSVKSAFNDYRRISELDPNDGEARYCMGIIALEFGDLSLSKQCLEEALAIDKKSADAKRGLALWNKLNGTLEEAVALYSDIIKSENRFSNYINRAECYLDMGKLQEAQMDISEAQKLEPSNLEIYVLKARLSQLQFRYDDAANYAKQALSLGCNPELVEPFLKKTKP